MPSSTFDSRELRNVLGTFVTGVTVVTTRNTEGKPFGVTANSFSSVSLDPPLVLWSQSVTSSSYPAFRSADYFAVNILADDQVRLSNHFAKSAEDKFKGIDCILGIKNIPLLQGAAAHIECRKVDAYPGGDHVIYLGHVERVTQGVGRPLAFGQGRYMVPYAHDLGPMSLGLKLEHHVSPKAIDIAGDALRDISQQLGNYTLCLSVWGNHGPTVIRFEPGLQPVSKLLRTGLVTSVTRSATGRAFAAFMPEEITRSFIEEDFRLSRFSDESEILQRDVFKSELEAAYKTGITRSANLEPSLVHGISVNAFSVPIRNSHDQMIMALTVVSRADRLSSDHLGVVPLHLKQAASNIQISINKESFK